MSSLSFMEKVAFSRSRDKEMSSRRHRHHRAESEHEGLTEERPDPTRRQHRGRCTHGGAQTSELAKLALQARDEVPVWVVPASSERLPRGDDVDMTDTHGAMASAGPPAPAAQQRSTTLAKYDAAMEIEVDENVAVERRHACVVILRRILGVCCLMVRACAPTPIQPHTATSLPRSFHDAVRARVTSHAGRPAPHPVPCVPPAAQTVFGRNFAGAEGHLTIADAILCQLKTTILTASCTHAAFAAPTLAPSPFAPDPDPTSRTTATTATGYATLTVFPTVSSTHGASAPTLAATTFSAAPAIAATAPVSSVSLNSAACSTPAPHGGPTCATDRAHQRSLQCGPSDKLAC